MKKFGWTISLFAAALASATPALAQETAVTFVTDSGGTGSSALTRGFYFDLTAPITVTSLGWYDYQSNGLANSHQVGIWSTAGALLLSGTVAAGTVDPLDGMFRYTSSLTGTSALGTGSYVIGGLSTSADTTYRNLAPGSVTFGPNVSYVSDAVNNLGGFRMPDFSQGLDIGYFGPNFRYSTGAVPEPATWALLLLGVGAIGGTLRSARRRRGKVATCG